MGRYFMGVEMTAYQNSNSQSKKDDSDKIRLDLIEPEFIEGMGEVLTYGVKKYEENSWQKLDDAENRYYGATLRHLMAYRKGEKVDRESGLSHLKHAAANIMFLLHFETAQEVK